MLTMFVVISWKYFGFHMILMLAGLQGIPRELEEAAAIDGASRRQTVRSIILPLLGPTIRVSVFLSIIGAIQLFDLVWATTRGGPFHASDTMAVYLVDYGIKRTQMGYGSAIAVILFVMALVVALALPALRHAPRHRGRRDPGRRLSDGHDIGIDLGRGVDDPTAATRSGSVPSLGELIRWAVLLGVAVAIVVPIGYAFLGGFRTTGAIRNEPAGFPDPWILDHYATALTGGDVLAAALQQHRHRRHHGRRRGDGVRDWPPTSSRASSSRAARRCSRSSRWDCSSRPPWPSCRSTSCCGPSACWTTR